MKVVICGMEKQILKKRTFYLGFLGVFVIQVLFLGFFLLNPHLAVACIPGINCPVVKVIYVKDALGPRLVMVGPGGGESSDSTFSCKDCPTGYCKGLCKVCCPPPCDKDTTSCEEAVQGVGADDSDASCSNSNCLGLAYFRLNDESSSCDQINLNLGDDDICQTGTDDIFKNIGLVDTLLEWPNSSVIDDESTYTAYTTADNNRDYAYIYIPTGQWSFGIKANQSVIELDQTDPSCVYCDSEHWPPEIGDLHTDGSTDNKYTVRPCCGGEIHSWMAANGSGTSDSPYQAPTPSSDLATSYVSYSSLWKSIVDFDYTNIPLLPNVPTDPSGTDTTALGAGLGVSYSYSWVTTSGAVESGNRLNDGVGGSESHPTQNAIGLNSGYTIHSFLASFGGTKQINGYYMDAWEQNGTWAPRVISLYCNGSTLVGSWTNPELPLTSGQRLRHIYVPANGSCSTMRVDLTLQGAPGRIWEATFFGESGTSGSGGSSITLYAYGSVNTGSSPYSDNGGYPAVKLYVDNSLVKTFYIGRTVAGTWANYTYTHSSQVKPEDVRVEYFNNLYGHPDGADSSKVLTVNKLVIDGVDYPTKARSVYVATDCGGSPSGHYYPQTEDVACNAYYIYNLLGNRGDTVWSDNKYYQAGWYPIQLSAAWDDNRYMYFPQLWWRKYNISTGVYTDTNIYAHGVGEAKISSCGPGTVSCSLSVGQSSISMIEGSSPQTVALSLSGSVGTNGISIVSSNTGIVQVAPSSSSGSTTLTLTPVAAGTALVSITGTPSDGSTACDPASITVYVTEDRDFWQVKDMDVTTTADLVSYLDSGYFDVKGGGEYPGIPVYGGDNADFDNGSVSEKGWIAGTGIVSSAYSGYTYSYFMKSAPSDDENFSIESSDAGNLTDGVSFGGYTWREYVGNLSVGSQTLSGTQKLVIFIDGNLTLDGNLILNDKSFLMFIVSGNIVINPAVTSLEGVFFAGNEFQTGAGSSTLNVRGSVVALGGVDLERDLPAGGTSPSEYFTYGPDLLLAIPYDFGARVMSWKEVSPSN